MPDPVNDATSKKNWVSNDDVQKVDDKKSTDAKSADDASKSAATAKDGAEKLDHVVENLPAAAGNQMLADAARLLAFTDKDAKLAAQKEKEKSCKETVVDTGKGVGALGGGVLAMTTAPEPRVIAAATFGGGALGYFFSKYAIAPAVCEEKKIK